MRCTTWWCVPSAPATHGPCWDCRPLGTSPLHYRSRAVSEPRSVLKDFGLEVADSTEIRVWDSTAEVRYMVLPQRPEGTEGMSEEELAELVSRDSMVGVALVSAPAVAAVADD